MRWTYSQDQVARNLIEIRGFGETLGIARGNLKLCTEAKTTAFWQHIANVAAAEGKNRKQRREHKQPAKENL